ncbi:hypothetical protein PTTG_09766 [Puccinia triticina 1-1 BBBD Race 1]|uniref:D-aminoacyl-tRNA deacylase n=2 Tax=Puccinia triticina TaxID=208348 RepID=A0A180GBR6_PUCT1|nr:uncharacterized protein PtA15_7A498 [Puccinia triticina]OAV90127.1 hypothetical protein PTTG_09766 [Puccinia triticina 1-1 BBBD Race 1]WAQ86769.1 hypothetical protein PtA15_7A498 [Puccinia triticina]
MRAVIQRVTSASVTVNQTEISRIGKGLCVLVGLGTDDTPKELEYIVSKILSLRLFPSPPGPNAPTTPPSNTPTDPAGDTPSSHNPDPRPPAGQVEDHEPPKEWRQSVRDIHGEVLIVSQFTLMAKTKKGNKPDFHNAMKTESSKAMYGELIKSIKSAYSADLIKEGQFGAMMDVKISNDGPVTIILDTNDK